MLTLMDFKLLLYLSSPNVTSEFMLCFDVTQQLLEVKNVVYYVMTKMGATANCPVLNLS